MSDAIAYSDTIAYAVASGTRPEDFVEWFDCVHKASDCVARERARRPHLRFLVWRMSIDDLSRYLARRYEPAVEEAVAR